MTTTVTAGNTSSFQMGPFDTITMASGNGVGSIALTSLAPKLVADQTLAVQNGTFGPYGVPMSCVMTVRQGSVGFDVNIASLNVAQALVLAVNDSSAATSAANLVAINAQAARFGRVTLYGTGTAWADQGIILKGPVELVVPTGMVLKSSAGRKQPFIRNFYCGQIHAAATFTRAANVVTVNDPGHSFTVGQQLLIQNGPDSTYGGLATVTASTASNWSYASTGSNGTAGSTAQFYDVIPWRQTVTAASVTAVSGLVKVSDPAHTKTPGMQLFALGTGNLSTFAPNPGALVQVAKVSADHWWYYLGSATGTAAESVQLSWEDPIRITGGGTIDGNRLGAGLPPTGNEAKTSVALFGNCQMFIDVAIGGSSIRGMQGSNCYDVQLGPNWKGFDNLVAFQAEGGIRGCTVDQQIQGQSAIWKSLVEDSAGQQCDDYVAFTGVKRGVGGAYDNVTSPYGLSEFSGIDVRKIYPLAALNGVKLTAHSTAVFRGPVRVGAIIGRFLDTIPKLTTGYAVQVFDDGASLVGIPLDVLQIDGPIDWAPASTAGGVLSLSGTGTANAVHVRGMHPASTNAINSIYVNGMTIGLLEISASSLVPVNNAIQLGSGTIRKLALSKCRAQLDTSKAGILLGGATVNEIEIDGMQISSVTDLAGVLIDVTAASTTTKIAMRGVRQKVGSNRLSTIIRHGNVAMGTLDISLIDFDAVTSSVFSSTGTGATGTVLVHLGAAVKWSPGGGSNFVQVGGGTWSIFGQWGTQVTADKLCLFGYGTPTYRIHMPSDLAGSNLNGANYSGAQVVPVNGDLIYNNNAGALGIGLLARRAGVWGAL